LIRNDVTRLLWPGSSVHVDVRVPRNVSPPPAFRGVTCMVTLPTVTFAMPGRVKTSGGSVPVASAFMEPDVGTAVLGMVSVTDAEISPWGATTTPAASDTSSTVAIPSIFAVCVAMGGTGTVTTIGSRGTGLPAVTESGPSQLSTVVIG
jgi:hypothetical protein